jgi:DNA-binding IclR family transcriptional regulator
MADGVCGKREGKHMIQSVDRAIRILGVLQGARRLSLSEISARIQLPPSTVHGILKTLLAHGMVVQDRDSSRYQLGPAVLKLGNVYLDTLELRSRALVWSAELARRTGYAVRTGVLLLDEVLIIHHEPRPDGTRQMPEIGIVIPQHASALGKATLAYLPDQAQELLAHQQLRSMTGETVTDPDALRDQLIAIAANGLATEREEAVIGECGAAAPIFDSLGLAAGAIGVVVPTADWPPAESVFTSVQEAARNISRELGAPRWPVPAKWGP